MEQSVLTGTGETLTPPQPGGVTCPAPDATSPAPAAQAKRANAAAVNSAVPPPSNSPTLTPAYALLDLNTSSTRLIGASLLEAVAVSVGAHRTPGGLQIAA